MADQSKLSSDMMERRERLYYVDGYKGICVIFVIITHYMWSSSERLSLLFPFWIDMAVPVFMIITGFVSTMSFQKNKHFKLRTAYTSTEIISKWIRFIIPFFPVFLVQLLHQSFVLNKFNSILFPLELFLTGGVGPGSYYFPVMLQVVLLMPLIYYCVRKCGLRGLIFCFCVNLIFEVIKTAMFMKPEIYRLCSLRYIFPLSFGCFLYLFECEKLAGIPEKERKQKKLVYYLVGTVGAVYLSVFNYTGARPLVTNQWTNTSLFGVFFIVPIMWRLLYHQPEFSCFLIEELGRASFNIFLVQMCYYAYISGIVYYSIRVPVIRIVVNIVICSTLGWIFYQIEKPITAYIVKTIRNN